MSNIAFDTLQFAKRAEKAGFTKQQAEFQAEEIAHIISTEIATKRDLVDLKNELCSEMKDIRSEIKTLRNDMESMANKLTLKVGAMMAVAIGVLSVIIKLGH